MYHTFFESNSTYDHMFHIYTFKHTYIDTYIYIGAGLDCLNVSVYVCQRVSNPLELWTAIIWYAEHPHVDITFMSWGVCVWGEIIMINDIISAYSASNFNNLRDMKSRLLLSHFSLTSRSISDMSRNWCECEKGKLQQHMIWWAVDDSIILRHMFITKNTWKQHHVRVFIFQRGRTTLYIHTPGIMWCQQ